MKKKHRNVQELQTYKHLDAVNNQNGEYNNKEEDIG